jgi:uncharacterized membrane protein YoaK (UPF0700 family)
MREIQKAGYDYHEKMVFGTLLAGIGGFLDAYTYILHKGVFANAQTGNIVLIGVSLINERMFDTVKYIFPVLAFIAGVVVSETIKSTSKKIKTIDRSITILLIEILILFTIGMLPASVPDIIITTAIAFISSVQISSFKKIRNSPYNTTMMTGNLRACTESLFGFLKTHDREMGKKGLQYAVIILCFTFGAGVGSILISFFNSKSIWVCCALQVFLVIRLWMEKRKIPNA